MAGLRPGDWRSGVRRLSQRVLYRAPGERDDCPACMSRRLHDLDVLPLRAARTAFVCGCDECGLVFSNPLPTAEELELFYSESGAWGAVRQSLDDDGEPATAAQVGRSWRRLFEAIRDRLDVAAPPPGASVLDFGCGEGTMLDGFQSCGWQTWGIEPAIDRAFARHGRLYTIPETPAFDLVLALHVLEHVSSPLALLRQLAGACKMGGHLLVAVPRFDTLPTHRDYRYVLNGRAHIMAYTWPCLRALLARAGWEAIALPLENRLTPSRIRVLARRTDDPPADIRVSTEVARAAIAGYYAGGDSRPLSARIGLIRVTARRLDTERQRAKAARKATALARDAKDR